MEPEAVQQALELGRVHHMPHDTERLRRHDEREERVVREQIVEQDRAGLEVVAHRRQGDRADRLEGDGLGILEPRLLQGLGLLVLQLPGTIAALGETPVRRVGAVGERRTIA